MKFRYSVVLVIIIFFTLMTQSLIASTNQTLSNSQYNDFNDWNSSNYSEGHLTSSYSTATQKLYIAIDGKFYVNDVNITDILLNITIATNTQHYTIGGKDFETLTLTNVTQNNALVYRIFANFSTILHVSAIDTISVNANLYPQTTGISLNTPQILVGVSYKVYDLSVIQVIYFVLLAFFIIYAVAYFFIGDENDPEEGLHVAIGLSQFVVLTLMLLRSEPISQRSSFILYLFSIAIILLVGYELPPYIIANRAVQKVAKNKAKELLSVKNTEVGSEKKQKGDNSFIGYIESLIPRYGKENLIKITLKELLILFFVLLLLVLFRFHEDTFPVLAIVYLGLHFIAIDPKSVI